MGGTELYVAIIIGSIFSLLYTEITGVLPAGIVVAGYLALLLDQPYLIAMILLISFFTYLIVNFIVARFVILYGRRKFVVMITVGVLLKIFLDTLFPHLPYDTFGLAGIGVIVPGIIANTIERQGVIHTVLSTLLIACLTFGTIYFYNVYV